MDYLYFGSFIYISSGLILLARYSSTNPSRILWVSAYVTSALFSAYCTWLITKNIAVIILPSAAAILFGILTSLTMQKYTLFGILNLAFSFCLSSCVMILILTLTLDLANTSTARIATLIALTALVLLSTFDTLWGGIIVLPEFSIKYSKRDSTLKTALLQQNDKCPFVSIHVPCHQEPPELVTATLDALEKLNYENYEVIVVDNNTKDSRLWRPVQSHCQALGDRFRFYHVDPLLGAKAGAMNFALRHTNPAAELIAAVDADYIAEEEFLASLCPIFNDAKVAFVQSSHDYREWEQNPFLSSVYYYYLPIQKIVHPTTNEFNAANLVGTMCLIRKSMLEEVGGWAEWSLTEDDELSVRLQARGYIGHVFADTWGRGLIPSTFEGVKKQLFRWLAGPIQEFRKNWHLHLGLEKNCQFSRAQRIIRIKRVLGHATSGLLPLQNFAAFVLGIYLIKNNIIISIPKSLLLFLLCGILMNHIKIWITIKRLGGNSLRNHCMTFMLGNALKWNAATAFIVPLFKLDLPWIRTNKFKCKHNFTRALLSTLIETTLAAIHFLGSAILFVYADFSSIDAVALLSIWMFAQAFGFSCALIMAIISENGLMNETQEAQQLSSLDEPKTIIHSEI
ncbi:glycosyltransferase [Pseudomonas glycinae]|uniref:glycosyltransferase n=1 Tax=Pseudomonas glycinae TaxID=1785145 RepID=UPI001F39396B|nr:glycosyltransferase [Pseudomonas glycinae]